MTRTLLIDEALFETRAALMQNETLIEVYIERHDDISSVGEFYVGRISKLMPSLDGAFVDLGSAGSGFILSRDIARDGKKINNLVHEGEKRLFQVTKDRLGEKPVQLSCRYRLDSPNFIFRPMATGLTFSKNIQSSDLRDQITLLAGTLLEQGSVTVRTSANAASTDNFKAELQYLADEWSRIQNEPIQSSKPRRLGPAQTPLLHILHSCLTSNLNIIVNRSRALNEAKKHIQRLFPSSLANLTLWDKRESLFEAFGAEEQLEQALQKHVPLPSGANIVLERTEAMIVIDVNSSSYTSATEPAASALSTNLEAAREIARQIRLRNYGGIIIVDFVQTQGRGDVAKITQELQNAFQDDPVHTRLIGMTELGLMQVVRTRTRKAIADILLDDCRLCNGEGTIEQTTTLLSKLLRAVDNAAGHARKGHIDIYAGSELTTELNLHKQTMESYLGIKLNIILDPQMTFGEYTLG